MMSQRCHAFGTITFLCLLMTPMCGRPVAVGQSARETDWEAFADDLIRQSGVSGGLIVHVDCSDGRLTAALGRQSQSLVQGLAQTDDQIAVARDAVAEQARYGRVSILPYDGRHLPYADNLVTLIVMDESTHVGETERMRVLSPGGVAMIRHGNQWRKQIKPWPSDMDQWTHFLYDATGNAVSSDRLAGPPRHMQWLAEPRWQRHHELSPSLSAMVTANGRLFAIINEAPPGIDGLPDRWTLIARDAFNGLLLWKRPIEHWGWSVWSDHAYGHGRWNHPTHIARRLVASDDRIFVTLGFNAPLTALDAGTGKTVMTYDQAPLADEILYKDGTLIVSVNDEPQQPGRITEKPPVGKSVVALDAQTGKRLWKATGFTGIASKADAIERVTHLSMVAGDDHVFVVEENALVAIDSKTGQRRWEHPRPERPRPVTYGSYYFSNLCTLVYHDGIVFFMEPDPKVTRQPWNEPARAELSALSAETGKRLWSRSVGIWGHYNPGDVFVINGLVWVHSNEGFSLLGIEPRTGDIKHTLSTQEALDQGHHHRCYRNKATERFVFTGRRGVELIDLAGGDNQRNHWVRGTCRYGIIPANGLLYAPPHPCICYITSKLNGFWALAPSSSISPASPVEIDAAAWQRGPASGQATKAESDTAVSDDDWPTYRHDGARSGSTKSTVNASLSSAWSVRFPAPPSSPVVARGLVLAACPDAHELRALSERDGQLVWRYTAGGRIDTPPTVYRGTALFGCADGWIYSVRLSDGQLAWKRRIAPAAGQIMSREQLESPWPLHGNVLVHEGTAYAVAGRSSFLDGGIIVCALDPTTGELLAQRRIDSRDPETGDMVECRLPYDMPPDALGALSDILVGLGDGVYMRHLRFDRQDLEMSGAADSMPAPKNRRLYPYVGPQLMSVAGLLDDSWFNQTYWTIDGKAHSKLIVFNDELAVGVKAYPGNARHSRAIFRPASGGYTLFANRRPDHETLWSSKVAVRVSAMALAENGVFAAGAPDVLDEQDPYAAMEGRRGGVLEMRSTDRGALLNKWKLPGVPVFDGMAIANGSLYLSLQSGQVCCMRPPGP